MCGCRRHFASEAPCTCSCASHRPAEAKTQADYAPGTVAVATVRGVPNVRVFRYECPSGDLQWDSAAPVEGQIPHLDQHVTDVRPLVVLDPEDRDQVERLAKAWDDLGESNFPLGEQPLTLRGYRMQTALRSLAKPPKPPEPTGLGAVVEDEDGIRWVRTTRASLPGAWRDWNDEYFERPFEHIVAVRVLSEGVRP